MEPAPCRSAALVPGFTVDEPFHEGPTEPGGAEPPPAQAWRWIPIRSLSPRHRERVLDHLLKLAPQDAYLRFGYASSKNQVGRYVDTLDFERDEVFGIFNRHLTLLAVAHLAHAPAKNKDGRSDMAEFGVQVLPRARGRGYGTRLFEHAVVPLGGSDCPPSRETELPHQGPCKRRPGLAGNGRTPESMARSKESQMSTAAVERRQPSRSETQKQQ